MIANKLRPGDLIRVVTPAQSYGIVKQSQREIATKRVEQDLGLRLSFGKHVEETDEFSSSSIKSRLEDLHEAFADPEVKGILCIEGGFNSNQLLPYLDWELIKKNPKVLVGYSDITVLNLAILAKTGLVSYNGPMFSTLGMKKGFEYMVEYLKKAVMEEPAYEIVPSKEWSDDDWESEQDERHFHKNEGPWVIASNATGGGEAEGRIVGGNLSSLALLQGTSFWPGLKDSILFLEDDYEWKWHHMDRCFQGIVQQPDFSGVKGIVWGRFEGDSQVSRETLTKAMKATRELVGLPIIGNVDFGHANPKATIPIGGKARIWGEGEKSKVEILEH